MVDAILFVVLAVDVEDRAVVVLASAVVVLTVVVVVVVVVIVVVAVDEATVVDKDFVGSPCRTVVVLLPYLLLDSLST